MTSLPRAARAVLITSLLLAAVSAPSGLALAGVGPENVVVVVNGDSHVSRTLANHYVLARQIPAANVIVLDDVPDGLKVSLDDFKTKILRPILKQIDGRGIANQTNVVAYSAGFPTAVDVSSHTARMTDENVKKFQRPTASITGMTFFYRFVLADDPNYLNWYSNLYARGRFERHFANPFSGEKKERFDDAMAKREAGEHAAAAKIFGELFDEYESLSPIAVRAAESHASAGNDDQAREWLIKAIRAGWVSATYLRQSEPLEKIVENSAIARVLDRLSDAPISAQGPIGFDGRRGWTGSGNWVGTKQGGIHYLLSCMLGVVHPRGSTVRQAAEVLTRASEADLTRPNAKVGFSKTGDVRTKTRFPNFGDALVWLAARGRPTDVFESPLPRDGDDYVGLVLGTASMNLDGVPWRLVPGAIAESLTSTGAAFETDSQTKLTELLHLGAAMSSGAVAEPYSLQFKFPLPIMHAYYAEGASAIEAFYLSVTSPYQLLVVGEPICQPFASPPSETVRITLGGEEGNQISMERKPLGDGLGIRGSDTSEIRIFVEGKLVKASPPIKTIQMNLPDKLSGAVNVRVVLVGRNPAEPRLGFSDVLDLRGTLPIPTAELESAAPPDKENDDQPDAGEEDSGNGDANGDDVANTARASLVRVDCPGADRVSLLLGMETIEEIEGESGTIQVDAQDWGDGPLRLRPIAFFGDVKVPGHELVIHAD